MNEALVDNGVSELRAPTLNPVLRVYKRFAQLEGIKIVNLFINNGYQVAVDGEPNLENALELGIQDVRFRRDLPTGIQRAEKASEVSGIPLPTRFDITEVLDHPQPVVAKNTTTDRGEGKYLLETDEQKVRFIAYLLHERRLQTIGVRSIVPGYLDELFTSVRSGNFDADALREISREMGFVQEEFVKAHGEYYASFRIVADAYGTVHYGQVNRSKLKKNQLLPTQIHAARKIWDYPISIPKPPVDRSRESWLLEECHESPFFLGSRKIVSNVMAGGYPVILDGKPKKEVIDRKLLTDLGIDPDVPQIPQELLGASSEIGQALRGYVPFVGIDFIKRGGTEEFVLLEANIGPGLRPEALGLSPHAGGDAVEYRLFERIIERAKTAFPSAFPIADPEGKTPNELIAGGVKEVGGIEEIIDLGDNEKVRERTGRVIKYAKEVGYRTYEVQTKHGRWLVVAQNVDAIFANRGIIDSFDQEQSKTELWAVWGHCASIHDRAKKAGVVDGEMRADYRHSDKDRIGSSIYPQGSGGVGHYIGFKNTDSETFYVDLTARVNVFTPTIYDTQSAFNGLAIIEPRGFTTAVNALYAANWVNY